MEPIGDIQTGNMDYDLYCETWDRRKKSQICNVGFENFPKLVEEWRLKKEEYQIQNEKQAPKIDNQPNPTPDRYNAERTIEYSIKGIDAKPWIDTNIDTYPNDWRDVSFHIGSALINKQSLSTLLPDQELDDYILSGFHEVVPGEAGIYSQF